MLAGGRLPVPGRGEGPLLLELYSKMQGRCLRSKTVVCYEREAFLYTPGNVRITLNRNVRCAVSPHYFLLPDPVALPTLDGLTVLEVKYDAFLPDIVRMAVAVPNWKAAACFKYALCRKFD